MGYNSELSIRNRKKAALVLAIIAGLLCFIGLFGTIMTEQTVTKVGGVIQYQLRGTFDLVYLFKNGWTATYYSGIEVPKFSLVLMIISFFIGTLGCLFVVGKTIYLSYKKENNSFKFNLAVLLVSSVQYIFMSRFALGYDGIAEMWEGSNVSVVYLMGWGAILITVGFFLGLISLFLYDFESKESVLNKTSILTRIASIVIFFVGLYGLTNMVLLGIKNSNNFYNKSYNTFSFITYLDSQCTSNPNYIAAKVLAVFACIFGVASFIGTVTSAFYYVKGADNEIEKKIVNFSTISFLAASLMSNIFMIIAGHVLVKDSAIPGSTITVGIGFTFIVSLILGIGLILLVYFRDRIFKKTK